LAEHSGEQDVITELRTDVATMTSKIEGLEKGFQKFNGQIDALRDSINVLAVNVANLPCAAREANIENIARRVDQIEESDIRRICWQRDLFRSLLAALIGGVLASIASVSWG